MTLLDEIGVARTVIAAQRPADPEEARHGVGGNNPLDETEERLTVVENLLVRISGTLAEIDQQLAATEAETDELKSDVAAVVKEGLWFHRRLEAMAGAEDEFWKEFGKTAGKAAGGGSVVIVGGVLIALITWLRAVIGL